MMTITALARCGHAAGWLRAVAYAVFVLSLAGCLFGGRFGEDNPPCRDASCGATGSGDTSLTLNERVHAYLQDWYLWYDQMPAVAPDSFASVGALVDAIRYRPTEVDRWSYVDTAANYTAFFEEGRVTGYGFGLARMPDNSVRIQYAEPGSPADLALVPRGVIVLAINGLTIAQLDAIGDAAYNQQLGVTTPGVPLRLDLTDGATIRTVTLLSATYPLRSLWRAELVTPTLGYLFAKQFVATTKDEIRAAFAQPGWETLTDLVVDLRYNGGGRISESSRLASHVLGAPTAGQLYSTLQYNAKHRDRDFQFFLGDTEGGIPLLRATSIRRVAVIVSGRTCSASEELIVALRSFVPAADFFIVGPRATCGKPYGFEARSFQATPGVDAPTDPVVSAVNFRAIALDGTTDYISGLTPRCVVADDLSKPLADPAEGLRTAARVAVETGACPVVAAADRLAPLSVGGSRRPDPAPSGVRALHGTW